MLRYGALVAKLAFRTISNSAYLAPTKGLFKRFNALNIFDIYKRETGIRPLTAKLR